MNTNPTTMATTISKQVKQIEDRISRIKRDLDQLGPMRPGSVSYTHLTLPTNREV